MRALLNLTLLKALTLIRTAQMTGFLDSSIYQTFVYFFLMIARNKKLEHIIEFFFFFYEWGKVVFGEDKVEVRQRDGAGSTMRRGGRRREERRGWLQRYARARDVYNATPFIFAHGSSVFGTPIPFPPIRNYGSPPVEPVLYDRARPPPASGRSPLPEK
ncbi:hypothetical protein B0H14DRAFT_3148702 [Mycena olivaceomarginata]|nr:hypothetical protein B0H14DRAFT_3148702 [Mycena olivaceomarginata]